MPKSRRHVSRLPLWGLVALVFGLVLACYWPAMHGAVLWDDPAHIPKPEMRGWDGLWRMWTDLRATQQYYPVLFSAFWVEHRLWGDSMFGYHLFNALLHAANSCLLGAVVGRLWRGRADADPRVARWAAWAAALLFAVHPVSVESVAWITEQKNTLSLLFALLATRVYLDYDETRRTRAYVGASLLFLAAIGSKTSTVVLPPIMLALVWWRRGDLAWRRDIVPLAPWFAAAIGFGLVTNWVEREVIGAEGEAYLLTPWQRVLLAGRIPWFFLEKLAWPADRAFFYHRWDVASESGIWVVHLAAAVAVTVGLWAVRKRSRGPFTAWLAIGGGLFPVLGFFNVFSFLFSYVADHYHYVAAAAALAAAGSGAAWLATRVPARARLAGTIAGVLAIGALTWISRGQSALYVHNTVLFADNVRKVPDSWMAHHILAHTLAKDPARSADAIVHYREALRYHPDYPDSHLGLAVELAKSPGTRNEALALYRRAIELRPHYLEAHNNLGHLLSSMPGSEAEAERHLRAALELRPDFAAARTNLLHLLARQPARRAEAIAQAEAMLRGRPDDAEIHHSLGILLAQTPGREVESLPHFREAVRLEPSNPGALNSLGIACAQAGRFDEARAAWARALEIDPEYQQARENLRLLEQMRGR